MLYFLVSKTIINCGGNMKNKNLVKTIVLAVVAFLLAAVMIAGNIVLNTFSLIINRFFAGDTADTTTEDAQTALAEADKVVRKSAEESIVLLKNDDYLPLKGLDKINLFGWGSTDNGLLLTGGGSGGTTITDTLDDGRARIKVDLTDALKEANIEYNTSLTGEYEKFSNYDADYRSGGSTGADVIPSLKNPSAGFYSDELMTSAKAYSDKAIVTLSRWGAENGGSNELKSIGSYTNGTFLELTNEEKTMFAKLQEYGFEVIVLLNVCNNIELGFLEEYSCIKACLHIGIPGQSGMAAVPKIITGEINPSGRTSDIYPYDFQTNNPVYVNAVKNNDDITYQEGIYYGYKWYETADADGYFDNVSNNYGKGYYGVVQYPFGYGLSYTEFDWTINWNRITKLEKDKEYTVSVTVENTGSEAGSDVVQLYGHAPYTEGGIEKAERVLLDFAKTPVLAQGQKHTVELKFTAYDLASYDDYDKNGNNFHGYELEAGDGYELLVMRNSHDVDESKPVSVDADIRYENDPVSGKALKNRFTGDTAFANCPVDGSTALTSPVEYLSRANKFANMPIAQAGRSNPSSSITSYRHTEYDNKDISDIKYGEDAGMYLVKVETQEATDDSPAVYEKATLAQLSGTGDAKLAYNSELLKTLSDYEAEEWTTFLNQLTETEVKDLIGMGGFQTVALETIGKPLCMDKDGPAGFNNNVTNAGKSSEYTLYPSESLLGCSWSKEVMASIGEAQGKIGTALGVNGWYGPGVNLHRHNYNSRNYEYFSEDGVLSGKYAAAIIKAAKDNNLYCYLKHFAISEEGNNPRNVNTWTTEQNLRENYLRPFEIAVKEGGANAIMSSFNCVGANLSGYNYALMTGVLREEWGFKGSVITDWYSGGGYMGNHTLGILGGNDLWLCGGGNWSASINLNDTAVAYAARQSVKNILYTYVDTYVTATSLKVNASAQSPLFTALWVLANVVLAGGIITCGVFIALPYIRKKKGDNQITAENGGTADSE